MPVSCFLMPIESQKPILTKIRPLPYSDNTSTLIRVKGWARKPHKSRRFPLSHSFQFPFLAILKFFRGEHRHAIFQKMACLLDRVSSLPLRASSQPPRTPSRPPQYAAMPPRASCQPPRTSSQPPRQEAKPSRASSRPSRASSQPISEEAKPLRQEAKPFRASSRPPRASCQPPRQEAKGPLQALPLSNLRDRKSTRLNSSHVSNSY